MERVDALEIQVMKLADATGVVPPTARAPDVDGATSDLDVEALTKGLLNIARDLEGYLIGLCEPDRRPADALRYEIGELEKDLATKRALVAKNTAMFTAAEEKFKTLKDEQLRAIYNPKV